MKRLHLLIHIQLWHLSVAFPLQGIGIKHTDIPRFRIYSLCEVSRAREMQNFHVGFKFRKALKQFKTFLSVLRYFSPLQFPFSKIFSTNINPIFFFLIKCFIPCPINPGFGLFRDLQTNWENWQNCSRVPEG